MTKRATHLHCWSPAGALQEPRWSISGDKPKGSHESMHGQGVTADKAPPTDGLASLWPLGKAHSEFVPLTHPQASLGAHGGHVFIGEAAVAGIEALAAAASKGVAVLRVLVLEASGQPALLAHAHDLLHPLALAPPRVPPRGRRVAPRVGGHGMHKAEPFLGVATGEGCCVYLVSRLAVPGKGFRGDLSEPSHTFSLCVPYADMHSRGVCALSVYCVVLGRKSSMCTGRPVCRKDFFSKGLALYIE
eukprot:CAMPEP_0177436456 /NCGR_PEP_ID=MMETSP0369-20130122/1658_1 /TAXON_ID=447022 ORGANISM="Scrippsiella hangoei-like, Strain SHHI-4" /NCGR_SAMPLE_ID=MMETSP0369 /ASSEMBLY_ACC=CAM_ASM_000364 /LENGTH=245 /DNA_ID=CAMNT_0018907811 /DNA_START=82 /DNA_END=821 /DNA_ORIENTATION=+